MSSTLKYAVLGSGSKANSYIFSDGETTILIDNGFSCAQAVKRIREAGFEPTDIDLIAVTHGHSDHARGVGLLSQKFRIPVYCHKHVELGEKKPFSRHNLTAREAVEINALSLFPFEISHDSPGSLGFHFQLGGKVITVLTDSGIVTAAMKKLIQRSQLLFLEANYCPIMLQNGPYPAFLKHRIESKVGHLSNMGAIALLNSIHEDQEGEPDRVYFCHLSEKNNSPEKLEKQIKKCYEGDIPYIICPKNELVMGDSDEE